MSLKGQPRKLTVAGVVFCMLCFGSVLDAEFSGPGDLEQLFKELSSSPENQVTEEQSAIKVVVPAEAAVYFFLQPGEPAYPGVIIRKVVEKDGEIFIQTTGTSFGDGFAFDEMLAEFEAEDKKMRESIQNRNSE